MAENDDFVDFSSFEETKKVDTSKLYGYEKSYDKTTMEYYRVARIRRMDPVTLEDLDDDKCFKFPYMWDPYSGDRLGRDPNGALCFNPDMLIKYFHSNRLNNLWIEPTDDDSGYYQGIYGMAVGIGQDIFINSRGFCPDKYVFRLPIIDCYLTNDHNINVVTMGPKLTLDEIKEIDELAKKYHNNYYNTYGAHRPNLYKMRMLYDQALSESPELPDKTIDTKNMERNVLAQLYNTENRSAVDKLKLIRG